MQVDHDDTCPPAEGYPDELGGTSTCFQASRLDEQGHVVAVLLPRLVVSQTLMRETCQTKAGIRNADPLHFVGQYLGRYVHLLTQFWSDYTVPGLFTRLRCPSP